MSDTDLTRLMSGVENDYELKYGNFHIIDDSSDLFRRFGNFYDSNLDVELTEAGEGIGYVRDGFAKAYAVAKVINPNFQFNLNGFVDSPDFEDDEPANNPGDNNSGNDNNSDDSSNSDDNGDATNDTTDADNKTSQIDGAVASESGSKN